MSLLDGILKKKMVEIVSPIVGECVSIKEVPDPTFSQEILGKGVAIKPLEGKVYAPIDGKISTLFPTLHAVGITTEDGVDILIHVGLDTVSLKGTAFQAFVKAGDSVKKGELLLEADLQAITEAGLDTITPILICNSKECKEVSMVKSGKVTTEDCILQIKK